MTQKCIVLCGSSLNSDENLQAKLRQHYRLIVENSHLQIEEILNSQAVDMILLELMSGQPAIINLIKKIKIELPEIRILVINGNGDQNLIARAFKYGAKDAFRNPYRVDLIVERISNLF